MGFADQLLGNEQVQRFLESRFGAKLDEAAKVTERLEATMRETNQLLRDLLVEVRKR